MSETQAIDWESRYRDGTTGWERHGLNPVFLAWREAVSTCAVPYPCAGRRTQSGTCGTRASRFRRHRGGRRAERCRAAAGVAGTAGVAANIEQADLFTWDPDEPFDAVYDQTCLCSLPPALWPNYVGGCIGGCGRMARCSCCSCRMTGRQDHRSTAISRDMRRLFAEPAWQWPDVCQSGCASVRCGGTARRAAASWVAGERRRTESRHVPR